MGKLYRCDWLPLPSWRLRGVGGGVKSGVKETRARGKRGRETVVELRERQKHKKENMEQKSR